MGDHEASAFATGEEVFPELLFGFDIEGAGEVVEDEQFCRAEEHSRGCGALGLAAGEFEARWYR